MIDYLESKIITQIRTGQKENLIGNGPREKISKGLKGGGTQPLKVLEIPNTEGILTTDEDKNDKIARLAWSKVFDGNI